MRYIMFKREVPTPDGKGRLFRKEITDGPVRVMAEADGYAMVRRKGCIPFVIRSKDILKDHQSTQEG